MKLHLASGIRAILLAAALSGSASASAVDSELYLAGLGLHQETGRNIYLGGIYLEQEVPRPANFTQAAGTRVMEYRVVARRTSMRSLLGGMLLQSEVATGHPPDDATMRFADAILSAVNTSLYAGDSLKIVHTGQDETIARLNGHELARVNDAAVSDYLLMGWVGESGPSTIFRNDLMADQVDPSLLSALEANTYSEKREQEIAGYLRSGQPEAAALPQPEVSKSQGATPSAVAEVATVKEATSSAAASPAAATTAANSAKTSTPGSASDSQTEADAVAPAAELGLISVAATARPMSQIGNTGQAAPDVPQDPRTSLPPGSQDQAVQLAALIPSESEQPPASILSTIENMGIQEYSRRLASFHRSLTARVYGEIRYPKRAVRRSLEGTLELDVTLTHNGELVDIQIARDSGHVLLDDAAMDAAKKAFKADLNEVDPVAIAEFSDGQSNMIIPIPISFRLTTD
ncbi:MAG: TonB family protein [Pseudomonadota bacterium]